MAKIESAIPILVTPDPRILAKYYSEMFGFKICGEPNEHFARVARDGHEVYFLDAFGPLGGDKRDRCGVFLVVDDVDSIYAEMKSRGAEFKYHLTDQPYGYRDFVVLDPEGYGLCFAEPK